MKTLNLKTATKAELRQADIDGLIGQKVTMAMQEAGAEIVVLDINKELAKSLLKEKLSFNILRS